SLSRKLDEYVTANSLREPAVISECQAETGHGIQISSEHGQLMALLIRLMGARRCIEVGTYTGTSSLWIALALPADGTLLCCDTNPTVTATARRHWEKAGVAGKIMLKLAPAKETLAGLIG